MASTINAATQSVPGLVYSADGTGDLALQSNGTTGITVSTGGNVTCANTLSVTGNTTLGNANVNSRLIVKGPTNLANGTVTSDFTISGTTTTPTIKATSTSPPTILRSDGVEVGKFARAWIAFNGSTNAVDAGFNVGAITDHGTGQFSVNFIYNIPSVYSAVFTATNGTRGVCCNYAATTSATSALLARDAATIRINIRIEGTGALTDCTAISGAFFG